MRRACDSANARRRGRSRAGDAAHDITSSANGSSRPHSAVRLSQRNPEPSLRPAPTERCRRGNAPCMARTLRTRASSSVKRPTRSYSSPSRRAPSATRMDLMSNTFRISARIASPPGEHGHALFGQFRQTQLRRIAGAHRLFDQRFDRGRRDQTITAAAAPQNIADRANRAGRTDGLVPTEVLERRLHRLEFEARREPARFMRFSVMAPSPKMRELMPTHPMYRLSSFLACRPSPMMISVLPPPMSTTSRRPGSLGIVCATPR